MSRDPTTGAKRAPGKGARVDARAVSAAPGQPEALRFAGALVDPAWVKAYEKAHPRVRVAAPLSFCEEIADALRPIATKSFDPALLLKPGAAGAASASGRNAYSVEVMGGFEVITQAVATTICDLHNGRLTMKDIGATQDRAGAYSLEATAVERHLSSDLQIAMRSFLIAATGVAEGFDRDDTCGALDSIKYAAAREAMEDPDAYFNNSEDLLDVALDGYDNMAIEALAMDLLERVRPGSMRQLRDGVNTSAGEMRKVLRP